MGRAADPNFEFQKIVAAVGVTLMAIKFFAYILTGSVSILTDAMESIVNVVAAFIGLFALYISSKPADRTHPFGHGKIETVSASVEGTLITVAGCLIILESAERLLNPHPVEDLDIGLMLIALTAAVNFATGRAAIVRGRKSRSSALVASGKHLCSDTVSSAGIIAGLGVMLAAQAAGFDALWLDPVIAAAFGCVIIYSGLGVIRSCLNDFMDRMDEALIGDAAECLSEKRHKDWIDLYGLRIIKYGPRVYVNLQAVFPKYLTLEEFSYETGEIADALKEKFGDSTDVSVVAVPCLDFCCTYCEYDCPDRKEKYIRSLEWTPETLCCTEPHADSTRLITEL